MFINKKGINFITGGLCAGDEIQIKTLLWSDVLLIIAKVIGLGFIAWLVWSIL